MADNEKGQARFSWVYDLSMEEKLKLLDFLKDLESQRGPQLPGEPGNLEVEP